MNAHVLHEIMAFMAFFTTQNSIEGNVWTWIDVYIKKVL
jgi:hypothetical protein